MNMEPLGAIGIFGQLPACFEGIGARGTLNLWGGPGAGGGDTG